MQRTHFTAGYTLYNCGCDKKSSSEHNLVFFFASVFAALLLFILYIFYFLYFSVKFICIYKVVFILFKCIFKFTFMFKQT